MVKGILKKLRHNDLFMKPSKCTFFAKSMDFLGMTVSKDGVSIDLTKVAVIKDYQAPYDITGIQHFLGMTNFY